MQALWMVLAAFLFASMGVCVKIASAHFNEIGRASCRERV